MTLRFIIPIISLTSALLLSGAVIGTYALLARKEAIVDAEFNLKERLGRVESDFARYDFEQEKFEANRSLLLLTSWPALKWAWLIRKDQEAEELIMDASLSRKDIGRVMLPDNLNHLQCDHLIGFVRKLMDKNIVSGVQVYHCEVDSRMFGGMRISDSYALVGVVDVDSIGGRDNDRESYLLLTVLIGGFVLYFATLYLYLNRKIYSRAVHLLNASFALKQGDLSARSRLKGGDELGMISQSFDAMADRIEQQTLELNQINQSLESKVEDRTKEAASLFQELETNIKQRENILLGLTHEMKTPLTGIMTLTESVMDGSYGELNEGQLKALQLSMDSSQKLYNLINRFLSYANLQMGKISLQKNWESLGLICDRAVSRLKSAHLPVDSKLSVEVDCRESLVFFDANLILDALVFVLENAFKFTPDSKLIKFKATQEKERVVFRIEDEGVGIRKEDYETIFEPLRQLDSTMQRLYSGVGLGLTLTREWVRLHGGEIRVESELGKGSCFEIILPQDEPPPVLDDE